MNEVSYERARANMVEMQLRRRGIRDERVLAAMANIPRHLFVPEAVRSAAYDDGPCAIGCGQTISQPYMVALMTEALALRPEDRVLEIGTGSGYQAAVLSELVDEVISIERHSELAGRARQVLAEQGCDNVDVRVGDGTLGSFVGAPFDAIIVTAGAPEFPHLLAEQLDVGGRMVCPVGNREVQKIQRATRTEKGLEIEGGTACVFVPLVGEHGWADTQEP